MLRDFRDFVTRGSVVELAVAVVVAVALVALLKSLVVDVVTPLVGVAGGLDFGGLSVTLRDARAYEFIDRLTSIALPRLRDFRGLNPRSFDGRGNYSMGIREQVVFPEIDYDSVDQVRGLDITITTSAATDAEAFALLDALGLPFSREGRPAGFESLAEEPAAA